MHSYQYIYFYKTTTLYLKLLSFCDQTQYKQILLLNNYVLIKPHQWTGQGKDQENINIKGIGLETARKLDIFIYIYLYISESNIKQFI